MSNQKPLGIQQNVELKNFSSWKVGGPAEYFLKPKSIDELQSACTWATQQSLPITVISGGTNILISDQGISGLIVHMREFNQVEDVIEDNGWLKVHVQAGAAKSEVLKIFLKHKLAPALFLTGLPGDIGGGVVMNAGVGEAIEPREFCEIVEWVEVLQTCSPGICELKKINKKEIQWSYRSSVGWQPGVITRVGLKWPLHPVADIMKQIKAATKNRLVRQPLNLPSCGSTFRNPPGNKAGQLIEQCGLKGFRLGGAEVSQKHANFIVTCEGAKASDVRGVIEHVRQTVFKQTGIELHTEVVFLG